MTTSEVLGAAGLVQVVVGLVSGVVAVFRVPDAWPNDPDWPPRASVSMGFWFSGLALLVSALLVGLAGGTQL